MAHFAHLNDKNTVLQVIVINNSEMIKDGVESEANGIEFCQSIFPGTHWVQTSYNANIRKNFAGIGFLYDSARDAFIPPKPFASWLLNEDTCQWEAPASYPNDGNRYVWDEATTSWAAVDTP